MDNEKEYKEDYEYSDLHSFIFGKDEEPYLKEGNTAKERLFKNIDRDIILDIKLPKNTLAIYLTIVKEASYEDYFQKIDYTIIEENTYIDQRNHNKLLKVLSEKGYIEIDSKNRALETNGYKIEVQPDAYIPFKLSQLGGKDGIQNIEEYVRLLRGIFLSGGNNRIPSYGTANKNCIGNLNRREYNLMKEVYSRHSKGAHHSEDVNAYLKLNEL